MEEFDLEVNYKGQESIFKAYLIVSGYTHKFHVQVNDDEIIFEPDEERNYRAVLNYGELEKRGNIDASLLSEIAKAIEIIVR